MTQPDTPNPTSCRVRSEGEETLALHLRSYNLPFEREVRFHETRQWRFDFVVGLTDWMIAVEVEGGAYTGGHKRGAAADTDCEKSNAAVLAGWKVLRFTTAQVLDCRAIDAILAAVMETPWMK
jgi:very-short-patch-repair endonuclease